MKDSGVEWIGEIPENWQRTALLNNLRTFITDGPHETPRLVDNGIPFISVDSLNDSENIDLSIVKKFISEEDYNLYQKKTQLEEGDILFSKSATIGKTAILKNEKCMVWSPLAVLKPNNERCVTKFLYYILNCENAIKYASLQGSYNTQVNLGMRVLEKIYVPIPPLNEQEKIAAFLDNKCGAIDDIITKTEQSIDEYKKLKEAAITKAVTKGIRSNRIMKDSNIEWIGEIPTDWEIKKFRHILKERTEKNIPIKSTERLSLSIDLGVTLYAEKTTNLDRFKDDFEQYKIAHEGDLVMNSMNMIIGAVGVSKYYGCVSPVYYTWYDETPNHTTAKYCEYLLRCKTIKKVLFSLGRGIYAIERGDDRVNTCRLKISRDDLKNLKLPLPSLSEQEEIINYLDEKCSEIDALIEKKQKFLTELANYKKSLIYEYITGKKEVA